MKNVNVENKIEDCRQEIAMIDADKTIVGTQYYIFLVKYVIVRACSTIEFAYKTLVVDALDPISPLGAVNYIEDNILKTGHSAELYNIHKLLNKIDTSWNSSFKTLINHNKTKYETALKNLVANRNLVAHGNSSRASIKDSYDNFIIAKEMIEILDSIISK